MAEHSIEPGTLLAGKLRVIRLIGEGGMGAVYEVEHELTKHRRALKMLHAQFSAMPQVVARFLREASAAGRIGSPHIVETFDAGHLATGEPYIVMEFLDGMPVDSLLQKRGPLPFHEAAEIVRQAAEGVQAAHDAGIVHRDLKPENLFLLRGDKVFVKILDFGISKFDPSAMGQVESFTVEGSALGTPFYMSPEQVIGDKNLDGRTDVYALGVVFYELLTKVKPFDGETLMELSVRIHEGKYVPASEIRRDLPRGVDELIGKALSVDRERRHRTVREFVTELNQLAVGQWAAPLGATIALPSSHPPGRPLGPFGPSALPQGAPDTKVGTLEAASEKHAPALTQRAPGNTTAGVGLESQFERRKAGPPWLLMATAGALILVGGVWFWAQQAPAPTSAEGQEEAHAAPSSPAPSTTELRPGEALTSSRTTTGSTQSGTEQNDGAASTGGAPAKPGEHQLSPQKPTARDALPDRNGTAPQTAVTRATQTEKPPASRVNPSPPSRAKEQGLETQNPF